MSKSRLRCVARLAARSRVPQRRRNSFNASVAPNQCEYLRRRKSSAKAYGVGAYRLAEPYEGGWCVAPNKSRDVPYVWRTTARRIRNYYGGVGPIQGCTSLILSRGSMSASSMKPEAINVRAGDEAVEFAHACTIYRSPLGPGRLVGQHPTEQPALTPRSRSSWRWRDRLLVAPAPPRQRPSRQRWRLRAPVDTASS
jgi:hypothetical protein